MEETITSKQWEEFRNHPVWKVVERVLKKRLEINRDTLEAGSEVFKGETETLSYSDLRFLQGESKGLKFPLVLMTTYEELLKEKEDEDERRIKNEKANQRG